MLWLITTTPAPDSRSRRIRSSTFRDSLTPSAAVGSSMMMIRPCCEMARPIATDCRWPPETARPRPSATASARAGRRASAVPPPASFRDRRTSASGSARGRGTGSPPRRACRRARDPGTPSRSRARAPAADPPAASAGRRPRSRRGPAGRRRSGFSMSVDFPAPLSPTSARISRSDTSRSTPSSATTCANRLERPRATR